MPTSSLNGTHRTDPADIAIVKGQTPAADRTWLTFPDGTARRVAVHVAHDLPHLAVESAFGLDDGLWGVLAGGGFAAANRAATRRYVRPARLVTDAPFDELAEQNWPGHQVAKAATNAVVNRWQDGADTPRGVRQRMRAQATAATVRSAEVAERIRALADRLDDETIEAAIAEVRRLFAEWGRLPVGGTLRLRWPLTAHGARPGRVAPDGRR
jgi:hypothetical protein